MDCQDQTNHSQTRSTRHRVSCGLHVRSTIKSSYLRSYRKSLSFEHSGNSHYILGDSEYSAQHLRHPIPWPSSVFWSQSKRVETWKEIRGGSWHQFLVRIDRFWTDSKWARITCGHYAKIEPFKREHRTRPITAHRRASPTTAPNFSMTFNLTLPPFRGWKSCFSRKLHCPLSPGFHCASISSQAAKSDSANDRGLFEYTSGRWM